MQTYIALGANLGDRHKAMRQAIQALDERVGSLVKCSSFYETAPVDFDSDNMFLNAVAIFSTSLSAEELLDVTQAIEKEMGRTQKSVNGQHFDRCIDIDILLLENIIENTPRLCLPHPKMCERRFVMEPLAEIAPEAKHPVSGKTFAEILSNLKEA